MLYPATLVARILDELVKEVQDEIYVRDPPEFLDDLIDLAIHLDIRIELRHRALRFYIRSWAKRSAIFSDSRALEVADKLEPMQMGRLCLTAEEKQC